MQWQPLPSFKHKYRGDMLQSHTNFVLNIFWLSKICLKYFLWNIMFQKLVWSKPISNIFSVQKLIDASMFWKSKSVSIEQLNPFRVHCFMYLLNHPGSIGTFSVYLRRFQIQIQTFKFHLESFATPRTQSEMHFKFQESFGPF